MQSKHVIRFSYSNQDRDWWTRLDNGDVHSVIVRHDRDYQIHDKVALICQVSQRPEVEYEALEAYVSHVLPAVLEDGLKDGYVLLSLCNIITGNALEESAEYVWKN